MLKKELLGSCLGGKEIPDKTLGEIEALLKRAPGRKDIVIVKFAGSKVPSQEAKSIKLSRSKEKGPIQNGVMSTWLQIERLSGRNGQWPERIDWLQKNKPANRQIIFGFDNQISRVFFKVAQEAISGKSVA